MASSELIRWGGLAAMAAGVVMLMTVPLIELGPEGLFYIMALVLLLLVIALPALHARQADRSGRLELVGFVLAIVGAAILTVLLAVVGVAELIFGFDPEEVVFLFLILVVGFFALLIGSVLFGIDTARVGVLPRWAGVLFALGLPLALLLDLLSEAIYGGEEYPPLGFYIGFSPSACFGWDTRSGRGGTQRSHPPA